MQIQSTDPDSPEALYCLAAYYALLAEKIAGVTAEGLVLPLPDADAYRGPRGVFFVAMQGDVPLGCVSLRPLSATEAEVKRLWVSPEARGQGVGRALLVHLEAQAQGLGYLRLKLDSNSVLTPALALYRATGWTDCAAYSPPPADVWMDKAL